MDIDLGQNWRCSLRLAFYLRQEDAYGAHWSYSRDWKDILWDCFLLSLKNDPEEYQV